MTHPTDGRPAPRTTRGWLDSSPPSTTWQVSPGPPAPLAGTGSPLRTGRSRLTSGRSRDRFLEGVAALTGVRLWGIEDRARLDERTPTFAIRVGDQPPAETAKELAARGICVWDGDYYAREIMVRLGLFEAGGAVRVGFCHYHTLDEVDRVLEALAEIS